nr:MAG TPA: hypothetical protein [Caudoviricetes sp.]
MIISYVSLLGWLAIRSGDCIYGQLQQAACVGLRFKLCEGAH